jgi:hypothetical protein
VDTLFEQVLSAHRKTLDRIVEKGAVERLRSVYMRATSEVLAKLERLGKGSTSFTAQHLRMCLAQLKAGQIYIDDQLLGELNAASREAQVESLHTLVRSYTKLEKHFTGQEPVLPIEEAARFAGVIDKSRPTLLRQHQTSLKRYGASMIDRFEDEMSLSMAGGETLDGAIGRVHGIYKGEFWQAERIGRTECLLGDTLVDGAVVRAASRRAYQGLVFEIRTERGRKLSATPNHPVLSTLGWIATNLLKPGDYLICHRGEENPRPPGNQNVAVGPSTLAQIFDSILAVGVNERRRTRQPDFHGDGMDCDVDIARTNGMLEVGSFSAITQPLAEKLLTPSNLATLRFCVLCKFLFPVLQGGSLCDRANSYTDALQMPLNGGEVDSVIRSQCQSAFSRIVTLGDFIERERVIEPGAVPTTFEELCPRCRDRSDDSGSANLLTYPHHGSAGSGVHFDEAQSRRIELDRVVDISFGTFSGHVFNLQTTHGYYAANGIYTANCSYAANKSHSDGIKEIAKEDSAVRMQWVEFCSPDGRPLDNRVSVDSIALAGQVAPVGGEFTMPAEAPFPDAKGNVEVDKSLVGKSWMCPPNRPNDRATIMIWKKAWGAPGWEYRGGQRVPV